jgi:transposase
MEAITTIGLDIAKSIFQVHGVDAEGNVIFRRQLKRRYVLAFFEKLPPCLVGIEACASAHHWSRQLQALGHTVRLMPPAYVKPYVKRHKNDATDAEAICEAVTRPNMRFVATKTPEQQSCLTLHRTRHLFIRQQTSVINSIRAHLAEFGIVAPVGRNGVEQLLSVAADSNDKRLPEVARACVIALGAQLQTLKAQILEFDRMIRAWHRSSETSRRLDVIPGVGPALATALVASIADPKAFRSGRDFSAWIGLVPKQNSSGGKDKLGSISKRGDRYLRSLFTTGALAVIRYAKILASGATVTSAMRELFLLCGGPHSHPLVTMQHPAVRRCDCRSNLTERQRGDTSDRAHRSLQDAQRSRAFRQVLPRSPRADDQQTART